MENVYLPYARLSLLLLPKINLAMLWVKFLPLSTEWITILKILIASMPSKPHERQILVMKFILKILFHWRLPERALMIVSSYTMFKMLELLLWTTNLQELWVVLPQFSVETVKNKNYEYCPTHNSHAENSHTYPNSHTFLASGKCDYYE